MKNKQIAFICGPYRSSNGKTVLENIRYAERYAIKYWLKNYVVICPHLNTAFFDGILPDNVWLDGTLKILKRCDILVAIPGWENSDGSKREIECAKQNKIHIIYEEG